MAEGSELRTDGYASRLSRRRLLGRASLIGAGVPAAALLGGGLLRPRTAWAAQTPGCPSPPATPVVEGSPEPPSGLKIGVTVAYLSVPFYANFKTGLEDGANRFGFEYELRDGQPVLVRLAELAVPCFDSKLVNLDSPCAHAGDALERAPRKPQNCRERRALADGGVDRREPARDPAVERVVIDTLVVRLVSCARD